MAKTGIRGDTKKPADKPAPQPPSILDAGNQAADLLHLAYQLQNHYGVGHYLLVDEFGAIECRASFATPLQAMLAAMTHLAIYGKSTSIALAGQRIVTLRLANDKISYELTPPLPEAEEPLPAAFVAGREAFHTNQNKLHNPYPVDDPAGRHHLWLAGWDFAVFNHIRTTK